MIEDSMTAGVRIEKTLPFVEVHDVMGGSGRWEVKVHDHGLVALLDVMPRFAPVGQTADCGFGPD